MMSGQKYKRSATADTNGHDIQVPTELIYETREKFC